MTSPDATPYVDLTIYDKDSQDVFEAALVNLQSYLPDWEPREGNTEVMLLESLALEVSESVFALNRMPGAIMEVLLRLYGVDRDLGTAPTASVTFQLADTVGHLIPAGTRMSLTSSDGATTLVFTTDSPLQVAAGASSGTVSVTAEDNTAAFNGTAVGTPLDLLDAVVFVNSVAVASAVVGGTDEEDDTAWFNRGVLRLARLVETLVLPTHFEDAALEYVTVSRAKAVDNYDPGTGPNPGDNPGHMTVAVYGQGGFLTAADKSSMQTDLDSQAQANLAVHVVDPTITTVDVTATVLAKAGYAAATVQSSAVSALQTYLDPAQWPWAGTVYVNELISLLDQVDGVDRVVSVTTPAGDLALAGVAPLAQAGTLTVTVNTP